MVNQKDFKLTVTKKKVTRLQRLFRMSLQLPLTSFQVRLYRKMRYALTDLGLITERSRQICTSLFNLNAISDELSLILFCFTKAEIPKVMNLVNWSAGVTSRNGYVCESMTATCVLLRRLTYPSRWVELEEMFGMHSSALSEVFYECAWSLYEGYESLLTTFRTEIMVERAPSYADAIHRQAGCLDKCVAFIDGTKIRMCRPGGGGTLQRSVYSGHKRVHCLVYQTLNTPDGLIFHLFGPMEGRKPDGYMYRAYNLEEWLRDTLLIDHLWRSSLCNTSLEADSISARHLIS